MFFRKIGLQYGSSFDIAPKMNLLEDTFPTGYDRMQKLGSQEVDVLTYPNEAHMTFGASSPSVRLLDV